LGLMGIWLISSTDWLWCCDGDWCGTIVVSGSVVSWCHLILNRSRRMGSILCDSRCRLVGLRLLWHWLQWLWLLYWDGYLCLLLAECLCLLSWHEYSCSVDAHQMVIAEYEGDKGNWDGDKDTNT